MSSAEASLKIVQKQQQIGIGDYLTALTALENRITLWQSLGGNAS
ncbi:outer membrane channel protein [Enterobacter sp. Ap-916]|nr:MULTISPECIES: outer membrane channel protein [unclassified Enterobacter]NIF58804.1 outer membrane channel protein [Enterobacter sp. Ap-867]NIG29782.1 outer membrane channel protein [Enterobacter sp. Ap-916]